MPAIDPATDHLEPVRQLVRELTGRDPSPSALWRWIHLGHRRSAGAAPVRLEAVLVSGRWYTTRSAWADFVSRQTAAALGRGDAAPVTARDEATTRRLQAENLL